MRWNLIKFIFFFAVILLFIVFNLENKCDINFGFTAMRDIPVFLTIFASFIIGMLSTLPFVFGYKRQKKDNDERTSGKKNSGKKPSKQGKNTDIDKEDSILTNSANYGID